ncbi:hypothetical protein KVV02_001450, partial [Mortierella alpina]
QCRRQNSSTAVHSSLPPQNALIVSTTPYSPSHPYTIMPQPIPAQFDVVNHPVKETLMIVSSLLSMLVHKNDSCYNPQRDPITLFHSRAVPRISIEAYLTRVLQYIPFTNEVLLNVLVYLDRIGGLEGVQLQQPPPSSPSMTPVTATSSTSSTSSASLPLTSSSVLAAHSVPNSCRTASSSPSNSNPAAAVVVPAAVSTTATVLSVPSVVPSSCISDSSPPTIQKRGREQESVDGSVVVMDQQKRQRTTATVSAQSEGTVVTPPSVPQDLPTAVPVQSAANGFRVNSFNIHRLLITCLMVAAKFTSDLFYSNARYAKVGGLSLPELNQLELEFLFTTKFELNAGSGQPPQSSQTHLLSPPEEKNRLAECEIHDVV